ncbi:MAG: 3-deoxy-D-manno-octulosonic acid transferase [Bacteroidaceae bacterium]|nr:3-deoxy-D-manno-octulosonic acid transferase [Bacteroidaceae bacterium]
MYSFCIYIYLFLVKVAALFNPKARLLLKGHYRVFRTLKQQINPDEKYIWFHAASLGEFEQGRPLIERIRREHPEFKILLTFFSPSGYEVRKNYEGADVVCYLPIDTPTNVRRFIRMAHPSMAFFIKYEFWQNYLKSIQKHGIPVYSVSSIFRRDQVFFRWYGGRYHKVLTRFSHLFVQNEESRRLLSLIGVKNVTVVGDTRMDRVMQIAAEPKNVPYVEEFKQGKPLFIAGSSWAPDEDLIIDYFNEHPDWKLILVPHEIHRQHLLDILSKLGRKAVLFTEATNENVADADCLIIDCFGLLSSIYRYADIAYVGGGFGAGIHNVPEAAVFGIPVVFGPNNKHFKEAQDLLRAGACFEVTDKASFNSIVDRLVTDEEFRRKAGQASADYIKSTSGATDKILSLVDFSNI